MGWTPAQWWSDFLCRRKVVHPHVFALSGPGGQAIATWINGCICINIYAAHHSEQAAFLEEVYQNFLAVACDAPFVFIGDWNTEVQTNAILPLVRNLGGHCVSSSEPTRWNGRRVIDYSVTNLSVQDIQLSLLPNALSDPRLIELCISKPVRHAPQTQLQPTFRYCLQPEVPRETFQEVFSSLAKHRRPERQDRRRASGADCVLAANCVHVYVVHVVHAPWNCGICHGPN